MKLTRLRDIVHKVRSKNAGPFWLTIDIFCAEEATFERVAHALDLDDVARLYGADRRTIKRFDLPDLRVIKFSLPRPEIQGSVADRDIHGASWANLLAELEI